jgi:hypothetical protein
MLPLTMGSFIVIITDDVVNFIFCLMIGNSATLNFNLYANSSQVLARYAC